MRKFEVTRTKKSKKSDCLVVLPALKSLMECKMKEIGIWKSANTDMNFRLQGNRKNEVDTTTEGANNPFFAPKLSCGFSKSHVKWKNRK